MDGHSSHYEPQSIEFAREKGVVLFCLPPHTTHDTQPLDVSVFKSVKQHWSDACHAFQQANPGMVINKYNFSSLFAGAWLKAFTPANIVSGFRKCGVQPLDRRALVGDDGSDSDSDDEPTSNENTPSTSVSTAPSTSVSTAPSTLVSTTPSTPVSTTPSTSVSTAPSTPVSTTPVSSDFTPDQVDLFRRRFEEGYDLPDHQYEMWVKIYHPEATSLSGQFENILPLYPILL